MRTPIAAVAVVVALLVLVAAVRCPAAALTQEAATESAKSPPGPPLSLLNGQVGRGNGQQG